MTETRSEAAKNRTGIFAPRFYLGYTPTGRQRHIVRCSRVERYSWHRALCGRLAKMSRIVPWHPAAKGVCERCVRSAKRG